MKYVRFKYRGMILFSTKHDHSDIAGLIGGEVISAGFVKQQDYVEDGRPYCGGYSTTLKMGPAEDDDVELAELFGGMKYC